MRVYVYPADVEACGYYRLIWATMALKNQGYDIRIIHPQTRNRVVGFTDDNDVLASVNAPKDADVMVFQRVSSKMMVQAVPIWRANGIAVVVDYDDDMSNIDPNNPAWHMLHPKNNDGNLGEYSWRAADEMCAAATMVTTSTPMLLRKYGRDPDRSRLLQNYVPANCTDIAHVDTPGLIGWGGNVRTHPNDPLVMRGAISRMQRDGYNFRVVGPSIGVNKAFQLFCDADITGGVPITRWHHELAKFSIGIAPLAGTRFNDAKSWLKMLEYASVGVPSVASPAAEYRRFVELTGVGLIAATPKDWVRQMRRLLRDDALRAEMSAAGRQIVKERLTIEANAWRWWEAWQDALRIQRSGPGDPFRRPVKQQVQRQS